MTIRTFSENTTRKILRLLSWFDSQSGETTSTGKSLTRVAPFEITQGPDEKGAYKGKRLYYVKTNDEYETKEEEYSVYNPTGGNYGAGDRLFCAFRGRWEVVGSPGGGAPRQTAIVMEAIHRTEDVTADPSEYTFGKIRVPGKDYPPGPVDPETGEVAPPVFDDCWNPYLAETEVAVVGLAVDIQGPVKRKNPAYDPGTEESTEPEFLEYYEVVEWDQQWTVQIEEDLYGLQSAQVVVSDINVPSASTYELTIHNDLIPSTGWFSSGSILVVQGMAGHNGNRLQVIGNSCPTSS